jgi:hypothetical protein
MWQYLFTIEWLRLYMIKIEGTCWMLPHWRISGLWHDCVVRVAATRPLLSPWPLDGPHQQAVWKGPGRRTRKPNVGRSAAFEKLKIFSVCCPELSGGRYVWVHSGLGEFWEEDILFHWVPCLSPAPGSYSAPAGSSCDERLFGHTVVKSLLVRSVCMYAGLPI